MKKEDYVVLVDPKDQYLGIMEKMEAHQKARLHRAVSVFIMNSKGEWLLQQRAFHKYHSEGLWSNTCCTHPFDLESYDAAAHRRLKEEMGMTCELDFAFDFIYKIELERGLTEHELDHVFVGTCNVLPLINPDEVADYRYISLDELKVEIKQSPEQFSFWFKTIFPTIVEGLNNRT